MLPIRHTTRQAMALLALGTLAACGGGSSPSPAPAQAPAPASTPAPAPDPVPAPAPATTLILSGSQLALKFSGQPRTLTITNVGTHPALDVAASSTGLPAGTSLSTSTCGATLAAAAACTLTVTPGAAPTATPGDTAPTAALLEVAGSNTNVLSANISVITYGSLHQGGWVFHIDDSTAATGSIGGKVAATADLAAMSAWGPMVSSGAASLDDGASNTDMIIATADPLSAAGRCRASNSGGFTDWYLPAICELAYSGAGNVCGTQAAPRLAGNMQSRLKENGDIGGLLEDGYWSSTESSASPAITAEAHAFYLAGPVQGTPAKSAAFRVRCARALTP